MDSHSRSASPREPTRPQHRPPSPPTPEAGFDNRAYQHDEADPNHNDSFTSNGPQQNGHTKEPNGVTDAKAFEAVNLELINLTPKNGSAKQKKDVEVDMNAANPYDEYFVPVNEHRKYMRGEKLYVTADKRGEKSGCKRPLCWTMLALVVAAIVAIIVLAATGVLFSNSPTPLEQYNTSVSSARALGGITPILSTDEHSGDNDHTEHDHSMHDHSMHDHSMHDHSMHDHSMHDNSQPDVTTQGDSGEAQTEPSQHGPDTQNDEGQHVGSDEANDNNVYVPRVVEGEVTVDNEDFIQEFEDPDSKEYNEFVSTFTEGLKRALFDRNEMDNGDNEISVEVVQLRKGSVIVTYRIHWKPKPNTTPEEDLFNPTSLETNLNEYLSRNNRMISTYHIAEDKTAARRVLDICQLNKNDCEYGCEFDEATLEFICTCPHGQILNIADPKKCVPIFENNEEQNQDDEKESRVLNVDSNPSSVRNIPMEEKPATESVEIGENAFDWKDTHHVMPETTTEVDSDVNFSHIFGHPTQHSTGSDEEPSPEPTAEPKAEPEPTAEPKTEPEPELTAEPKAELEPEPTAEPKAEPEPEPTAEPKAEPEPTAEPKDLPEPEPTVEPKAEPEPTAEPKVEPEPEPTAEPKAEPEPTAEPKAEPEPTAEPKAVPEPEPTVEPKAEPEPTAESKSEPEPNAEPNVEPGLTAEPKSESESTAEPKAEPEPTAVPNIIADSQPKIVAELEPNKEPTAEPNPEPTAEPIPTLETELKLKPESESVSELNSKSEVTSEGSSKLELESNIAPKLEATSEATNLEGVETVTMHEHDNSEQNPQDNVEDDVLPNFNSILNKNNETETLRQTMNPVNILSEDEPMSDSKVGTQEEISENVAKITTTEKIDNLLVTDEPKPTSIFDSSRDSGLHTDHLNTAEEKSVLYTNEGKFEYKPSEGFIETTTLRVLASEPSYEPKPEIISILNNVKAQAGDVLETTTTENEWLESESPKDMKIPVTGKNTNNETDKITYEDIVNISPDNEINHESEQRSFKNIDAMFETTTPVNNVDDDITFKHITNGNEPAIDTESKLHEDTTIHSIRLAPATNAESSTELDVDSAMSKTESPEDINSKAEDKMKDMSVITNLMEGGLLKNNETGNDETESTTTEVNVAANVYNNPIIDHDKKPMEELPLDTLDDKNHTMPIEKSSAVEISTESADVTFDAINMMYNRSSKVIKNRTEDSIKTQDNIPDIGETHTETIYRSTESDWLSEPVTEVSFSDAMNKQEDPEIIHTTTIKIEDIMPHGLSKEDFEPDYFSSIGNNNNKQDQNSALYGMVHDYDSEDNRIKRVNEDKHNTTESTQTDSNEIFKTNDMSTPRIAIETTTVSEYIYKSSQKSNEEPIVMLEALNETKSMDSIAETPKSDDIMANQDILTVKNSSIESFVPVTPAPVWEESESEKHVTGNELSEGASGTDSPIPILDTQYQSTLATSSPMEDVKDNNETTVEQSEETNASLRNNTQMNNFNVTIYEISSQNSNSSTPAVKATNSQSTEYEDHETEMNPFLPEIENNKSLVKILQEGHDLESTVLNETQNENTDGASQATEISNTSTNSSSEAENKVNSSTNDDTSFNELLHSENSHENQTEVTKINETPVMSDDESKKVAKLDGEERLPSFLTDTEDLVFKQQSTTPAVDEKENEESSATLAPAINNEDLSVVPITEEKEELEKHKSELINDISDSINASEKRTLDATKSNSDDNEA